MPSLSRCLLPLLVAASALVAADPLTVRIVPMNGASPDLPHLTWGDAGVQTVFKAVASGGTAVAGATAYTYRWDFNADGIYDTPATVVSTASGVGDLPATYAYPAFSGDRDFNARIQVVCGAETVTATYKVRIYTAANATPAIRAEKAIDDGLWWLHRHLQRNGAPGGAASTAWLGNGTDSYGQGATAMAVQILQNGGHLVHRDRSKDPYVDDVAGMHNWMLNQLRVSAIAVQTAGNPDVNGNGFGIHMPDGVGGRTYINALVLTSLATGGTPDRVAPVGQVNVVGRTYRALTQDMVEWIAWAQGDSDTGKGHWNYDPNQGNPDGSQDHFVTMALQWSESKMGLTTPAFVRTTLEANLGATYNSAVGAFGYNSSSDWQNVAKTGGNLSTLALLTDLGSSARVQKCGAYLAEHWAEQNLGDFYAMYAVMKGARSFDPHIDTFVSGGTSINWYDEYRTWLLAQVGSDGSWACNMWPFDGGSHLDMTTAMAVEILQRSFLSMPPVAVGYCATTEVPTNSPVHLTHDRSFHYDPARRLVRFEWDLDANGTYEISTTDAAEVVTLTTGAPAATYTPHLRVTDDRGTTAVDVQLSIVATVQNHAPVAVAIPSGDYIFDLSEGRMQLDGTASHDPDAPADSIILYEWDINGDDIFGDLVGSAPILLAKPAAWVVGGTYSIALRVTDDGAWDGNPATDHRSHTASASVRVIETVWPVADNKSATLLEDHQATITGSGTAVHSPLTMTIRTLPAHGMLHQTADGTTPGVTILEGQQVSDGQLRIIYVPAIDYVGPDAFTYSLFDTQKKSLPATVSLTVTPVNDAPSYVVGGPVTVTEDCGPTSVAWATVIRCGPATAIDEVGQVVIFDVVTDLPTLFSAQPVLAADGTLTFTPASGASGVATCTVNLRDNGGVASGGIDLAGPANVTFTIIITAVNDPPEVDLDPTQDGNDSGTACDPGQGPVLICGGAVLVDGDNLNLKRIIITLVGHPEGVNERIGLAGGLPTGITVDVATSVIAGAGWHILVLQGPGVALADWQIALRLISYTNDTGVDRTDRRITVSVTDESDATSIEHEVKVAIFPSIDLDALADGFDRLGQFTEGVSPVILFPTGILNAMAGDPIVSLTVTVTNAQDGADEQLSAPGIPATLNLVGAGTGSLVCTTLGAATTADFMSFLHLVTFVHISNHPTLMPDRIITVQLGTQSGGFSAVRTMTVHLMSVDNAPSMNPIAGLVFNEDEHGTLTVTINDPDSDVNGLVVSGTSDDQAIIPNTGILCTTVGGIRTVTLVPALNANGNCTVTFTVSDGAVTSSQTCAVQVLAVNDPPSFVAGPNISVAADSGPFSAAWATHVLAGPPDEAGQTVHFDADFLELFTVPPAISPAGVLTFTPSSKRVGVASCTMVLWDDGGTARGGIDHSAGQSFVITITPTVLDGANVSSTSTPTSGGCGAGAGLLLAGLPMLLVGLRRRRQTPVV